MAIKNKNLMMSLTESLNENKKQEIANFKKLKEATEDNISYVKYLLDTAEDMDDVQQAIYQIDDSDLENEVQLMFDSCSEDDSLEEVISLVISTMEDNAEYDEEMNESIEMSGNNMTVGEFYQDSVDKLKANKLDKDMVEVYDINEDYQGPTWVIGSELTDAGKERFKDFLSLNIDKFIDDSDEYKIYVNTNGNINLIDDFLNAVSGNISESDYDEWFVDLDEEIDESDESDESNEDDRKNTLIAKKDELEARLGEILQSIKDKQMDTDEFRKLSREAADLDSEIMDLDNQIRGVYECDKQINESDEDVCKGITDQLVSAGMTKEQAEQTAKGICNIFKNKVGSNQVVNEDDDLDKHFQFTNLLAILPRLEDFDGMIDEATYAAQYLEGDSKQTMFDLLGRIGESFDSLKELLKSYENTLNELGLNESVNQDGFPNSDELQKYFIGLSELPDEVEIDNVKYKMEQYGGSGDNCYAIYTDINNNDSYIKVFYSLNKTENGSYKGISKINGVSDLRESAKPIKEAAITEKNLLKSQGNVYMFECKGNSDFSHIVGENYNEEENTLENVETYNNKEDADKDYLGRCEITTESQNLRNITNESDDGSYDYEELWVQLPETFTAFVRNEIEDAVGGDLSDFMDLTAQDILDSYNENYGEEIFDSEEELEDEEESYNYLGYIESRLNDAKQKASVDKLDSDSYKVKSYHVENMGGGTMAIFGQLEDGRYFAGNEDGLNFYDIDVWPYYEKDTSDEEFQQLEKDHNIGSIDSIDNRFEYEKIISQTNF